MGESTRTLAYQEMERIYTVRQRLYDQLEGEPVNAHTLAKILAGHYPKLSLLELEQKFGELLEQVERGHDEFERLYAMDEAEIALQLPKQIQEVLEPLGSNPRQYLLLLFQLLYQSSGYKIDSDMAIYLANLPIELLRAEVGFLLQQKGNVLVGETIDELTAVVHEFDFSQNFDSERLFNQQEIRWVDSIATYTGLHDFDDSIDKDRFWPEQIGFELSWAERFRMAVKNVVIPTILRLLVIAGITLAIYCFIKAVMEKELLTMALNFMMNNHNQKLATVALFTVPIWIFKSLEELLTTKPFLVEAQTKASLADQAFHSHIADLHRRVHQSTSIQSDYQSKVYIEENNAEELSEETHSQTDSERDYDS